MKNIENATPVQRLLNRHSYLTLSLILLLLQFILAIGGCGGQNSNVPLSSGSVSVAVSPHSATVQVGTNQQFNATVAGTTNGAVTWSATQGTVSSSGVYTAPGSPGTFTVTATSQTDSSKFDVATVTVTTTPPPPPPPPPGPPPPTPPPVLSVVISPSIINLPTGATQQFTATVSGNSNTSVQWSTTAGTITTSGFFTAPSSAGTPTITATSVADPTKSASAQVLVGGAGTPLAQAAGNVAPGNWVQFTAAQNSSWNGGAVLDLAPTHTGTDNATAWSTKGAWNPVTKEFYAVGGGHCGDGNSCPGTQSVVRYNDTTNTWSVTFHNGTHTYEGPTVNTTVGTNNNVYLRLYSSNEVDIFNIATQSWTGSLGTIPSSTPNCCNALEYFPDRNSLIAIDNDNGIYEYTFSNGQWSGNCKVNTLMNCGGTQNATLCSTHTTAAPWARYDPVHHRMLFGGCTSVYSLSTTLVPTQLASAPFDLSVGSSASPVTFDPGTGKLITWDTSGHTFTFDGTSWVNAGSSPFADPVNGGLVCTAVSSYNVVMCFYAGTGSIPVTNGTVWLYKAQ